MQINSISKINYQNFNKKFSKPTETPIEQENQAPQELKMFAYNDLAFKSKIDNLVRPTFESPVLEKLAEKTSTYLKILPKMSKMREPINIKVNDKQIEFYMDKMNQSNLADVSIKIIENDVVSRFNMKINKNGQLIGAACYEPGVPNILFERPKNSARKIKYGDISYRPSLENENIWVRATSRFNETNHTVAPDRIEFNRTELEKFMSEMAKKDASILGKC